MSKSAADGVDQLFLKRQVREDFAFTEEVAAVFEDMLQRSVPCYRQVIETMAHIIDRRLPDGALIYDLGCSVGTTLLYLAIALKNRHFRYIGIDKAPAMLARARSNCAQQGGIQFLAGDVTSCPLDGANAVLCNYTLQFLRPVARQPLMERIFAALPSDGIFLLSEKTIALAPTLNRDFIAVYHDFKKANGYTEMEIATKREALENVLVPFSLEENIQLLRQVGFREVAPFFTWFNFSSLVALKK